MIRRIGGGCHTDEELVQIVGVRIGRLAYADEVVGPFLMARAIEELPVRLRLAGALIGARWVAVIAERAHMNGRDVYEMANVEVRRIEREFQVEGARS